MSFVPDIQVFCCHYTSQQILAESKEDLRGDGLPEIITINRLACGGKLKETTLLSAFENGADGVYVVGCDPEKCHNVMGSQRAAKRVEAVKKALAEMDVEADRVAMFHLERGFHPEFVQAAVEMNEKIMGFGPSPFKKGGEK